MHRGFFGAILVAAGTAFLAAQQPAFEVASIKQNVSGSERASVRGDPGGRITVTNTTLFNIIRNAYRLEGFQILGGPDWIHTDRWDIVAKAPADAGQERVLDMAKTLLADRFKLRVHRETRELPTFALVMARPDGRLGPQLKPSSIDCAAIMADARARGGAPPRAAGGGPLCSVNLRPGRMITSAATMADVARNLTPIAGRTIVDRTGLAGGFDLELTWMPDSAPLDPSANAAVDSGGSLFTAVQEQLGLRLEAQKGPVDVIVVDAAERPTED